jgi:methionine-rich copper-binding protein CopC
MLLSSRVYLFAIGIGLLFTSYIYAHAILLECSPVPHSTVTGPNIPFVLKFNSRVDAARSRLFLVVSSQPDQILKINESSPTDKITATASDLKPGSYLVRWQVLAVDGHVTRGQLAFDVK